MSSPARRIPASTTTDRARSQELPGVLCACVFTVLIACLGVVLTGCRGPLLSPNEDRSQFDNYDRSRGTYEPQDVEDPFGRREPNIKGRLAPKQ